MNLETSEFSKIGVVGAGVIGSGVVHFFAQQGIEVAMIDLDEKKLESARQSIRNNVKLYNVVGARKFEPEEVLCRVHSHVDLEALSDVEFVIENITEDWSLKEACHQRIDRLVAADTPVAANTSAIPITRIASVHSHPERVVGMHFMNPVPVMPVVELIRGVHSSESALESARRLVDQAGRQTILVNDSPGFVTNRVMMLMVNEAMFLVHEGVAAPLDVDRLFKTCFGHKMGPLATADMIGLDTVLKSLEVIQAELNDDKYRPCPLLKLKVYAGHIGRKSGQGFFNYEF